MTVEPIAKAFSVEASDGVVLLEGECGIAATLTPEAALETSDRLFEEAARVIGERAMSASKSGG